MKKKRVNSATMLNLKTLLMLLAFGVWVYVMMYFADSGESLKDAIFSYGGNTLIIISIAYILLILLELLIDTGDID